MTRTRDLRRVWTGAAVGGTGVAVIALFAVLSGLQYAAEERHGREPGYTPDWILAGMSAGGAIMVLGVILLVVAALRAVLGRPEDDVRPRHLRHGSGGRGPRR